MVCTPKTELSKVSLKITNDYENDKIAENISASLIHSEFTGNVPAFMLDAEIDNVNSHLIADISYNSSSNSLISESVAGSSALNPLNNSFHNSDPHRYFEKLLSTRVVVVICIIGVLGNLLNLLVLTRRTLKKTMARLEKSSHTGLVALSLSDMLFCIVVIPQVATYRNRFAYVGMEFIMLYRIYSPGVINTFIMLSTWLTVTMAMQRYLAICHPIKARQLIGVKFIKWSVLFVLLFCIFFNIPRYFFDEIYTIDCMEGGQKHFIWRGPMKQNKTLMLYYLSSCFIIGLLIPIIVLTFCNYKLMRALQNSNKLRRMCSNESMWKPNSIETTHRITLTLVVIVVMYTILVTPAEIANFVKDVADTTQRVYHFNFATAILNTAQSVNFAFNFILYCAINTHFRKTLRSVFLCSPVARRSRNFSFEETTRTRLASLSTVKQIAVYNFKSRGESIDL